MDFVGSHSLTIAGNWSRGCVRVRDEHTSSGWHDIAADTHQFCVDHVCSGVVRRSLCALCLAERIDEMFAPFDGRGCCAKSFPQSHCLNI